MKTEKSAIWASPVLIQFSIAGNIHAFLCHLPRSSMKPNKLKDIFLCLPLCKPHAFGDKSFELGFMEQPNNVFRSSPSTNNEIYINWLNIVEKKKGKKWKNQGIFDLIQLSRTVLRYNVNMLIVALYFWESSTYAF